MNIEHLCRDMVIDPSSTHPNPSRIPDSFWQTVARFDKLKIFCCDLGILPLDISQIHPIRAEIVSIRLDKDGTGIRQMNSSNNRMQLEGTDGNAIILSQNLGLMFPAAKQLDVYMRGIRRSVVITGHPSVENLSIIPEFVDTLGAMLHNMAILPRTWPALKRLCIRPQFSHWMIWNRGEQDERSTEQVYQKFVPVSL
jgi:hypothetical protein